LLEGLAREPKRVEDACAAIEPAIAELVVAPHVVAAEHVEAARNKGREAHAALAKVEKEREALGTKPSTKGERAPSLRSNATILFAVAALAVIASVFVPHARIAVPVALVVAAVLALLGVRMRKAADQDDREAVDRHDRWCKAQDDLDVKQLDMLRD